MNKRDSLIAGIGIGVIATSFIARVFNDLMWLALSIGILLLILGSTGALNKRRK